MNVHTFVIYGKYTISHPALSMENGWKGANGCKFDSALSIRLKIWYDVVRKGA